MAGSMAQYQECTIQDARSRVHGLLQSRIWGSTTASVQEGFRTLFVRMSNSLGLLTFVTSCSFLGGVGMRGGRFPGGAQWCTSSPNVDKILYRTWLAVISEGGLRRCLYGTYSQNAKHQALLT